MGPQTGLPEDGFAELTDKQREAVENGFFERPQGATVAEIADDLGLAVGVSLSPAQCRTDPARNALETSLALRVTVSSV